MPRVWREHHKGDFAHAADLEMGRHLDAAVRKGDCQTIIPLGHDSAVRSLPTTLMVLSVPTACTREDLASEWGMDGSWDFLYLPMYSGGKRALGYAFINFVSETASADFFSRWQGRHLANFQRGRPLNIVVAELQGFEANLCHVRLVRGSGADGDRNLCLPGEAGRETDVHLCVCVCADTYATLSIAILSQASWAVRAVCKIIAFLGALCVLPWLRQLRCLPKLTLRRL